MATRAKKVQMKGVFVNVPAEDWPLFCELVCRFGWQAETREHCSTALPAPVRLLLLRNRRSTRLTTL
ncbi:MAG: hypothetical protein IKP91_04235 [Bacteroidaceae bacterium]|nr:hypothetical protein [Bacteroidaceae bacterium]